jgi:hypothetical protein
VLLPSFFLLDVFPALAEGMVARRETVYFVAIDGSDSGPGTKAQPWATLIHAAEQAKAGDTIVVRGGRYMLRAEVRPRTSGRSDAWITYIGYPGEKAVLDAGAMSRESMLEGPLDNGAFQIEGVSYIRVINLTVANSHDAGFTVRDSSHIDLINDSTSGTFSSGIAVWDTHHDGNSTKHIRILGNTVTKATTWDLAPAGIPHRGEPPHEAISIGGAVDFEVAYNHVYDSDKEGIDIKETSKNGKVDHNLVYNVARQGVYVDAWFGQISGIEIFSNVVHNCHGAGLVLSVENGQSVSNVDIHNNLIFDNDGSGLLFSRWGVNNERRDIDIHNNVFYHNGYGRPAAGQEYYWITGGLYLYSTRISDVSIRRNIFSQNRGFQIGYSQLYLEGSKVWQDVARDKNIRIDGNVIDGANDLDLPIISGGNLPDRVKIYAVKGSGAILGNPMFKDPANEDFTVARDSPAVSRGSWAGAYAPGSTPRLWWKSGFPPKLFSQRFK